MIKAVFFDVDGTLYSRSQRVSAKTIESIQLLREQGILCGIATGRSPESIRHLKQYFDIIIAFNGQIIEYEDRIFYESYIHPQDLLKIYTYAKNNNKRLYLGSGQSKELGSFNNVPEFLTKGILSLAFKVMKAPWVRNIAFKAYRKPSYPMSAINQCVLYIPYHESITLGQELEYSKITYSNPFSIDIISKENSKLSSIKKITEFLNIDIAQVMAFGDGINDLEMIEGVGVGVAMGNAEEELKEVADYITDTHEAEGIYKALTHFDLV